MSVRRRVPPVDDPDFIADVDYETGAVLRLVGSADGAATRELAALLDELHAELLNRGVAEIVVDLRELDFMSAGCVRELVAWFGRLDDLDATKRYRIRLRSNPAIAWQRHTIPALSCFDTVQVTVER